MIDTEKWIKQFLNLLDETFQNRVWFVDSFRGKQN